MGNVCRNLVNEEKKFINEELITNRVRFFREFLDEDDQTKYVVIGFGDEDLILNREQLINLIHSSRVKFEIVSSDNVIGILNDIPFIIEYL